MADSASLIIATGLVTVLGSIAVPIVQHILQSSAQQHDETFKRLEDTYIALNEQDRWLDQYMGQLLTDKPEAPPSPLPRAQVAINLYFPEVESALLQYEYAEIQYRAWMVKEVQVPKASRKLEGYGAAYTEYSAKLASLRKALAELAKAKHAIREESLPQQLASALGMRKRSKPTYPNPRVPAESVGGVG